MEEQHGFFCLDIDHHLLASNPVQYEVCQIENRSFADIINTYVIKMLSTDHGKKEV